MFGTHYLELAKIRLTAMVLVTTAVGYVLASAEPILWTRLLLTVLGTGMAAIGAGTFNQLLEVDRDARMERTRLRPLPSGAISRGHAFVFAVVAAATGLGVLHHWVNPLTALLGLANVLIYTLIYTPLKPRTPLCTLVGAVCGALPPVMGCSGATNRLTPEALVLGAILFVWQVPHFLSLVWLYRADYTNAGYRILPVVDSSGRITCLMIILFSLALLPLGLAATFCGMAGCAFGALSLAMGLGLLTLALQLWADKTRRNARRVFLATIAYLPLLLLLMVADSSSHLRASAEQTALLPAESSATR
jgi:protoheme IX farnesyltransferase